jgi:serine/threonine protein phosphatase PrpC
MLVFMFAMASKTLGDNCSCREFEIICWTLTESDTWVYLPAVEAFVETDQRYLQHETGSNRDDGCTAVAAVLVDNKLLVANVGDSRAVLSRGGKGGPIC